uniref:L-serine deaminase n=4 Tax=Schistocephalus solidus TaxID=70667 RepID=A0A0X3P6S0_SCHSO
MIEEIDLEIPDENDPEVFDPECDPNNPRAIDFHQVLEAVERIKGIIQPTTCVRSRLSDRYGLELYFKKEFEHLTGSFKERGACNTLSAFTSEQKRIGAISASTGNHSSAMALHAKKLGIPVTVVMPTITPIPKINNCLAFGAKIILKGKTISEARRVALKLAHQHGYTYVNGYDHPNILAGQGTIGLEILQQVPDVDAIIVPVGGAGLIAGVTCAVKKLKPSIKIYGVESEQCPSFSRAWAAGKPVYTPCENTLADGLLVPTVGVNSLETLKPLLDKIVTIDESFIMRAILQLLEVEKSVVEGAGAIGFGAIIANTFPELKGKKVVCILCGGNIDSVILGKVIDRALAVECRLVRFKVSITDRVGGLADLCNMLRDLGVCIREVYHDRCFLKSEVFKTQVKCIVETRDEAHAQQLHDALVTRYSKVKWKIPSV